jgi:hypothetical protein
MRATMILPALLCLASPITFAESWTGDLVDSACYQGGESNVNPFAASPYVSHDRDLVIRQCRPRPDKTKRFAVVEKWGQTFQLDPAGNAKVADLVRNADKKSHYIHVTVTGEKSNDDRVRLDSISIAR